MTDVYIICSDGVFRRMLELELTEYGANVMPEGSAVTAPPLSPLRISIKRLSRRTDALRWYSDIPKNFRTPTE